MWHTLDIKDVINKLKSDSNSGLDEKEVEIRQKTYGENKLEEKNQESIIKKFIKQFNDFMIIILILAAIVSSVMAYIEKSNDYLDSIIIIGIVILNAIMGLIQENKAEKSLEALKKMSAPTAKVKRNGKIYEVQSLSLVPGDIVILEAGNYVPADCRLISTYNLKVDESALTGENLAVCKDSNCRFANEIPIGDMLNMIFATTMVTNGHAEAIVTSIGMNTKVGKIAKMIITEEVKETPLQKKLGEVGKILGLVALGICFAIFIIGLIKNIPPTEMFMTSIGLAVAAIPEGLPAIVTIMLSIGVTKMARKNAIIRKLPAVETLGSSSVICSDKTGTLTQNKMEVVELTDVNGRTTNKFILQLGSMCNNSSLIYDGEKILATGEPTEVAIVNAGLKCNENKDELYKLMNRVNEIPFDSERKLMTTIHKFGTKYRIITKGAPDVLLNRCKETYENTRVENIDNYKRDKILKYNLNMAGRALRVLGVAYKDVDYLPTKIESQTIECDLVFVGLIGMIDPPREGVKEAVTTCKQAGIKTVMITGDHVATAKAIATELGILNKGEIAVTGTELDKISQKELENEIMKYSVFARVSPEHKVRIVKAYKSNGRIVAMTGDGVNDAPALKNSDIGVSMGIGGTDVAKNASDMILTDDNFVTIVEAIKEGRHIFDNIKKAVHFLLATNIGEIVTIFLGLLLGLKSPLLAIHLLWINLITDSFPAIALGLEQVDKEIMKKEPRSSKKSFFSDGLLEKIIIEGLMIGILTLLAFSIGINKYNLEVGRTMAFVSLGALELVHSFNIRTEKSIFKTDFFANKYLIFSFLIGVVLQFVPMYIKPIANIFNLVPLNLSQLLTVAIISIAPIIIIEIQKRLPMWSGFFHKKVETFYEK